MRLRWLALASMLGCTPSGPPAALELDDVELRPKPAMASEEPRPTIETRCGGLAIAALGEWQSQDPLLEQLQHAWDPRGAQGEPIALRRASAPAELAGHKFVQLSVLGGSRDVIGCYTTSPPDRFDPCATAELAVMLFREQENRPRPSTARGWAELFGMLDSASAVFDSNSELARCVPGLRQDVVERVPELGMRVGKRTELAFVERLDPTAELTMLVVVRATIGADRSSITREELLTVDREVR